MSDQKEKRDLLNAIGNGLDRFIGVFSPKAGLKRSMIRQYAAAKTTRTTGGWNPVNQNVNDIIGNSSQTVRTRIRQLVRDFPYFTRAINNMVDFSVGSGIVPQSRIKLPTGKYDKAAIQKAEDEFRFWADEADVSGKLHLYELMRLAKRQDIESGEYIFVKVNLTDKKRRVPFALQMYEADWLTDINTSNIPNANTLSSGTAFMGNGNVFSQGIEYEKNTGRVVAYHFTDPDSWGKTKRIPAELVIHGFDTLRPGQLRGISPFVSAVLVAHDLNDYMDAEMDTAKMAAKYLAIVETNDPYTFQNARATIDTETNKKIEELENAIIEYLRPGEKINFAQHNRPGDSFTPFVSLILHMMSVSTGIPYELLSGDYSGISYSNLKGIRNDFAQHLIPISKRHVLHCCHPIRNAWMESAILSGRLPFRDYFSNPYHWQACVWQLPGMENIDPLRETKANVEQVKYLLRSPQEICAARGRDYEEVLDELEEAKNMAEDRGLTTEEVSTALANNPDKLGAGENEEETKKKDRKVVSIQR